MLLIIFMMAIEKFLKLSTFSRALMLLDLIDQIPGATATIPRMFQNMIPLAAGQVISLRLYVILLFFLYTLAICNLELFLLCQFKQEKS